ncbi:ATP-dependent DNA helicase RecQ [Chryseobacterium sp. StRB126]|uniref:hypothetical protein n=1 Tax=Chryseobacterium sp. StRB126 TaxID=878220 RepID=UPI0004E98610|nr:hypothetical protein [Chryseobacterium sp. StRB126]BAP32486.1 ATP-dependent DNA helicase RecQ [Chryseobacterium sp. StRB126]
MSYFDETLILLKEKKDPKSFMMEFNEKLRSIDVLLRRYGSVVVIFHDTRNEEEKEYIELDEPVIDEYVIDLLCSWKGLGFLSYRHPDFKLGLGISYLTWDDEHIDGLLISFAGKDVMFEGADKQKELILKISQCIDYEYIVGDVGDTSEKYISMEGSLEKIKEHIMNNSFTIDSRTW